MINKKSLLCLFIFFSLFTHKTTFALDNKTKLKTQCEKCIKNFSLDFASLFAKDWAAIIAHQLGSAAAAKILLHESSDMHLGCDEDKTKHFTIKIPIGKSSISFHSLLPGGEWLQRKPSSNTKSTKSTTTKKNWKKIVTALAGPLSGVLAYYLINLFFNSIKERGISIRGCINSFLDTNIFDHLIKHLIPNNNNSGAIILKEFYPKVDTTQTPWRLLALITSLLLDHEIECLLAYYYQESDPLFIEKETIKKGNKVIIEWLNDSAGTLKNFFKKDELGLEDLDNSFFNFLNILWNCYVYPPAFKKVYFS